jgi:Carboxypeptidase regulatory-like domain/TonB dependent receptor
MNRISRVGLVIVVALLAAAPAVVWAQVGAILGGRASDDTGATLPGVTVTITNTSNGTTQVLVTGTDGTFRAVALPPAPYVVKADLTGFAPQTRSLTLTVGADAKLDFTMKVAALEENVTVSGELPLVETARSEPTSVVLADQIRTLPVLDRNFLVLAQTLPGSAPLTAGNTSFATTKFGGPADQRNGYTTIIDGGSVDDTDWGSPIVNVSQDAVQEFKVFRNQFDAQYGAALVAVVSVATKSGTNAFSGSGYYFGRDQKLDATNAFATTKLPFDQTRAGGSFGGPIAANKTHFFGAFENLHVNNTTLVSLPGSNPFASLENGMFPTPSREKMGDVKVDHQFTGQHSLFVRYAYDSQSLGGAKKPLHDVGGGLMLGTNSTDSAILAHSTVAQDNLVLSDRTVNSFRIHYFKDYLATLPNSDTLGVVRPSFTWGQSSISPQIFDRYDFAAYETLYMTRGHHDFKVGIDLARDDFPFEAHFNEKGVFTFTTDTPFDVTNPKTYPTSFTMQSPGFYDYKSTQIAAYAQDEWQMRPRLHVNAGLRYDVDTNMRINGFYGDLLNDPFYAPLGRFRGNADAGMYLNTLQPRLGATYDVSGNGSFVIRGGWGRYVTRNRPWFDTRTMNQTTSSSVFITDPNAMKFYPSISGVLGGKSLSEFAATASQNIGTLIPDHFKLPSSLNSTIGFGWQLNKVTSFDVDYVNTLGRDQIGLVDLNLPASGPVNASNPRPVRQFAQVLSMENYVTSTYNALQMQLRTRVRGANNLQVSYTYSKNKINGVDFFSTLRGTQRTPQEAGDHPLDTPHNLSVSASTVLPFDIQLSGIAKALSGPPFKIQAGPDLDGDGVATGDRPAGLPPTIGRGDVTQQLALINVFRGSIGLPAIDAARLDLFMYFTLDMRVTKAFRVGGRQRIEAFLEGFNVTNHVNLSAYNSNMNTNSFLIASSARPARQVQWGMRYSF